MASDSPPVIYPWYADELFLREELNAQKALGLILDKRAWWGAWSSSPSPPSSATRALWMQEIEAFLVVVHIREIQLTPEHPTIGEKNWNEEGTKTDQIIATGVVFYSITNLTQPRLAIRKDVDFALHMPDDNLTLGLTYGLANQYQLEQELGHITAMEGRCVVLPNLYRYILEPFGLDDRTRPGTLGMLTILLVAPSPVEKPLLSTASESPEQVHWIL